VLNLTGFLGYHARRAPERLALIYEEREIGYGELWARALAAAALLARRGIGPGDVVAVLMKNSPAFLELCFAASHLGAIFLPINFRLARDEVAYICADSGARLLFADDELAASCPDGAETVLVDTAAQRDSRALGGTAGDAPEAVPRGTGDLFRLMYTSGTTDHPKGVMHSYDNFYWKSADHLNALDIAAADRLLTMGPLYHVGAFDLPGVALLWRGGAMCVLRDYAPEAVLAAIERHRLTCGWMAPVMLSGVLAHPGRERFDLASFKWLIGGGERTPENRIREFGNLFTAGRYIDGYGLTESCSGDTLMEAGMEFAKIGSTGRALAHVEVTIRDDAGNALPAEAEGEICLRGPKITRGYWNAPEKTAESFFADRFRTGDVGRLDADGFLYLTDRKKDMIISGGENIASSEVERVLQQLPQVFDAAVVGLPDERWGERPVAVVVLRPGSGLALAELDAFCRRRLAGFKVPKALFLVDELPRNPSGKVLKRVLRERLAGAAPEA